MKKAFRKEIEDFEIKIVNAFNNNILDIEEDVLAVVNLLKQKFSINRLEHTGNEYNSPGDIKLITTNNDIIYIELKKIAKGKGTLANISQDALTNFNIFNAKSWSDFRKDNDFFNKIIDIIISEYDSNFTFSNKTDFENQIRKVKDNEDFIIIKKKIEELARQDKINYIQYLKNSGYDRSNLNIFVLNMFNGTHTAKTYNFNIIDNNNVNYYTCYLITTTNSAYLESGATDISDLEIIFPENTTGFIITSNKTPIIRIAFHWKNIFQGIKTPCLNIFDIR